ncbi:MAG: tryptophan--tRNA ligase [Flavobacteriales bacterium]|nr:tryptophan--tRNA ligase [Flavobacteriales bacterium]
MTRYLTGIQATGTPHLGNILGAIIPAISLTRQPDREGYYFIANLHSLTAVKDPAEIRENTYAVAAAWLSFGFDTDKNVFYRQSDIPEVCELMWYLQCFTPFPMLANAHSFKDKSERLADVNAGLFTYPVLMACDILMFDANVVPVGKDQKQHLEITRDIAGAFNAKYGDAFVIPEVSFHEEAMVIPGTDGQKMSKSYNNFINIFLPEKELRKQVMRIQTDSTPLEAPKNPDTCTAFKLYSLLAPAAQAQDMRIRYLSGGYGYGEAKQTLFELLRDRFVTERQLFADYMCNRDILDAKLAEGAERARSTGREVLQRVKNKLMF